jgi:hypothetical protein
VVARKAMPPPTKIKISRAKAEVSRFDGLVVEELLRERVRNRNTVRSAPVGERTPTPRACALGLVLSLPMRQRNPDPERVSLIFQHPPPVMPISLIPRCQLISSDKPGGSLYCLTYGPG